MNIKFLKSALAISAIFTIALLSNISIFNIKTRALKPNNKANFRDGQEGAKAFELMRLHNPETGLIPTGIKKREHAFASTLPVRNENNFHDRKSRSNMVWAPRGPWNVGGRTRAVGIDLDNDSIILAGGVSGGMWRSTDQGQSWNKTTNISDLQSATCIEQDKRSGHHSTWYYGTGEYLGNSAGIGNEAYQGDGIFKSNDNGTTWSILPATSTNIPQQFNSHFNYIWRIVTDPADTINDVIYAATYGNIFRSADGGGTWSTVVGAANNNSEYTDIAITSTGVLYATLSNGFTKGIFRSTDGLTWVDITPTSWPTAYNRIVPAIAPSNENVVYFIAETPGSGLLGHNLWKYIYISGDGTASGGQWENRSTHIPHFGGQFGDFSSQDSYDLLLSVKPDDENMVFAGGTNIYRSKDGFASDSLTNWIGGYQNNGTDPLGRDWQYPNHHPDQHALKFFPSDPQKILSTNDGGIQMSVNDTADSLVWVPLNNGYITGQFYSVALDHASPGNEILIGGLQDNGSWFTNNSITTTPWVALAGGDGGFCAVVDHRTSYYASIQGGVIGRAVITDQGVYQNFTRVDPRGASGYLFINPFALDPDNQNRMFLAGGQYIWRNSDLTAIPWLSIDSTSINWTKLTNSLVAGTISAVAVSKSQTKRVYYGTHNGRVYRLDNADTGNPMKIDIWTGKGFPPAAYVSCISINPNDYDQVMVAFSNYGVKSIFKTSDGGGSWTCVSGNLEQFPSGLGDGPSVRWISIIPASDSTHYFAATSTGLYSTTLLVGDSTVWVQEGASVIGNEVCDMIDFRQSDGLVVVATHGNGMYSSNLQFPSALSEVNRQDDEFSVNQSPNPFTENVLITINNRQMEAVNIVICDSRGKKVKEFSLFTHSQAENTINWNGESDWGGKCVSGLYLVRVTAHEHTLTKRVILARY